MWCDPAESLLQSRVIPLAILEDRSGEGRAILTEALEVPHIKMGSRAGVGQLSGGVHPKERLAPVAPPGSDAVVQGPRDAGCCFLGIDTALLRCFLNWLFWFGYCRH